MSFKNIKHIKKEIVTLINPPFLLNPPNEKVSGTWFVNKSFKVSCIHPGLMSIASYLRSKGILVEILDFQEEETFESIIPELLNIKSHIIGISSTTGYDYLESLEIARIVKQNNPNILVVGGGQHIGSLQRRVFEDTDNIDIVVKQEGEIILEQIIEKYYSKKDDYSTIKGICYKTKGGIVDTGSAKPMNINLLPEFDFPIFPNYQKYTPYVEESRGCFGSCSYCSNNLINLNKISIKDSEIFSRQLRNVVKLFGRSKSYAILAANFGVNPHNTAKVIESIKQESISWTTELRVDNKWEYYTEALLNSNLEIVSVGLESASPTILAHMNKTTNIQRYLEKTQRLVDKFAHSESDLRLNLMLYAGETPETINETISFLSKNQQKISSIICSPIIMIENTPLWKCFNSYVENFGTSLYESEYWIKRRVYPLNLSVYFNFNDAINLCSLLEKIYSDPDSWVKERKYLFKQELGKEEDIVKSLKRNIFG